jgi:hypothetical protein
MAREGVPLNVIQRQLGHTNLGVTSIYLRASTTARSSKPSTPDPHRPCQPVQASAFSAPRRFASALLARDRRSAGTFGSGGLLADLA